MRIPLNECLKLVRQSVLAALVSRVSNDQEAMLDPSGEHIARSALRQAEQLFDVAAGDGVAVPEQFQRSPLAWFEPAQPG
jgi:hypothetical protein